MSGCILYNNNPVFVSVPVGGGLGAIVGDSPKLIQITEKGKRKSRKGKTSK